jgi:Phage integrase, N-terminal SAM-like domain
MTSDISPQPISPLRARMIEDMSVRGFKEDTRRDYVRHVRAFAAFIGRSPDTATAEELRLFQLHQTQSGLQPPSINSAVSALRFFFTVTLDRPDLARRLTVVPYPRRIPTVLSVLCQATLRRAPSGARLSRPLHAPRRHCEQPAHCARRARRDLPVQGLPPQRPGAIPHNDAQRRRVHQTLPAPRATKRISPHPSLRAAGERRL